MLNARKGVPLVFAVSLVAGYVAGAAGSAPDGAMRHIDLRHLADNKTVLRNPHKGWYWHYIDNGYGRINYRDPKIHPPGDYLQDFPGLNHLYLRVDWSDIEAKKDVYDWSYVDAIMKEWGAKGYRFAFRVCCYEGDPALPYATPRWLRDMGCAGTDVTFTGSKGTAWEPDYGAPLFLERLEAFIRQYAAKFDGHPLVEYVDLGSYGTWGEGHTWMGTDRRWPVEVLKKHADIHARHFRKTPVLMNDDIVSTRVKDSDEARRELAKYFQAHGMGIRDDSVCVGIPGLGYDTLRAPWLFDLFWKQAPVDIENQHISMITPEVWQKGGPFLAALERTHATYAGFHGYPREWLKGRIPGGPVDGDPARVRREYTERIANRLGYWYFFDAVELPEAARAKSPMTLVMEWRNAGLAPAYHRFNLRVPLENAETGAASDVELPDVDSRRWMPGEVSRETVNVSLPAVPAGVYRVKLMLYERVGAAETVIQLGVKQEAVDGKGYVQVAMLRID